MADPFEQVLDGDLIHAERSAAAFEPRQVEQVAGDVFEPLGFFRDDAQIPRARRLVQREVRHRMASSVIADLERFQAGARPLNRVTPKMLERMT